MARISYNDNNNVINNVIQLKKEFKRNSGGSKFLHVQVYHKDGWYIYKVNESFYEVFKENIVKKADYVDGKICTSNMLKVKYPEDEDFGFWAWCVNDYDRAIKIVNSGR